MSRIAGFDGIRGLSILAVVYTHLHVYSAAHQVGLLSSRIIPMIDGLAGVQAFFILSGFLITYLLVSEHKATERISLRNFYVRRALRIFPVYFLVLVLALCMSMWLETGINRKSFLYAFLYVYNFIPKDDYAPLIGHTWSLAVEEHFYLLWPVTFVVVYRKKPECLFVLLSAGIAGSHLLNNFLGYSADLSADYFVGRWSPVAGGHIALGCLGALLVTAAGQSYRKFLGSRATLGLAAGLYASSLAPVLPHDLLRPLGLALIIVWVYLNQQSRLTRFLETKPLAYLGTISYGIYMYQGSFCLPDRLGSLDRTGRPIRLSG